MTVRAFTGKDIYTHHSQVTHTNTVHALVVRQPFEQEELHQRVPEDNTNSTDFKHALW